MTEKTIYIANDGKEFNDENECKCYEFMLLLRPVYTSCDLQCFMVDAQGRCVLNPLSAAQNEMRVFVASTNALIIKTAQALEAWNAIADYFGWDLIPKPGIYICDADCQLWVDANKEITYWENVAKTLMTPVFKNQIAKNIYNKINAG